MRKILLSILALFITLSSYAQAKNTASIKDTFALVIHGGAGSLKRGVISKEKEFEKTRKALMDDNSSTFSTILFDDIYRSPSVQEKLHLLFKNESQIEESFDEIYRLQHEKIKSKEQFEISYPQENTLRKKIASEIEALGDIELNKILAGMQYYSKETLYQHRDEVALQKWINKVNGIIDYTGMKDAQDYLSIVQEIGSNTVKIKKIEIIEKNLVDNLVSIIKDNKKVNSEIEYTMEKKLSDFIDTTNITLLALFILTFCFAVILGLKVNRNVAFSVDEIEQKISDGLKEINNLNKEIESTQKEVVFTMGAIGESLSKETGNHVKRVAQYTKLLALSYGLPEKEAEMLKQASPMHDIGKVAIPDSILNKPGRFDEHEREIMNTHARLGYDMLAHSERPLLKMASIVAHEHHEKWDGTGYPRGLKGDDIHIYGRITAIADVFDALGSDRVYKKAWSDEKIFNLFR